MIPWTDPAPIEVAGRLFGYWGMDGRLSATGLADVGNRLHGRVICVASSDPAWTVRVLLPMARAAHMKVTLRMTGGPMQYTDADGSFDLDAWKAKLALWEGSGVQSYIDDGTLVGHMVLDDIANFDGQDPTAADLDEMARYSKEILPGLMTFVRERATEMPVPTAGTYTWLDACVNQYKAADGDVTKWASAQAARSAALGLGVINGLNIANGGDGSSGQPGWETGKWAMSGAEITSYGSVLAVVPTCGMFLNWEYDGEERWSDGSIGSEWFDKRAQRTALVELGALVAAQPEVDLLKP
jgi:hypothetical protein